MVSVTSTSELLPPIPVRPASPVSSRANQAAQEQKQSVEQVANSTRISDEEVARVQQVAETGRNERQLENRQSSLTLENSHADDAANSYGANGQSTGTIASSVNGRGSLVDFYI
ncbi:hypothetical protein [Thalassospira alkalitolerans]|uniref:hypothetical protein n=1 Tax=Thalassospira alkalitolerans TaxID=1293890 RepID=UPI003AA9AF98